MSKRKFALIILMFAIFGILQVSVLAVDATVEATKIFDDGKSYVLNENVEANGCDGAIYVENGTKLTINGGNIKGLLCGGKKCNDSTCGFCMALWAYGKDTEVIINDGYFTNETDGSHHCDLIYVRKGAKVNIKGGTFKCSTPSWTLNSHDTESGLIEVTGGKFFEFNPATANDEAGDNGNGVAPDGKVEVVVPDGYTVVKTFDSTLNGWWYEVQPISLRRDYNNVTVTLNEDVTANGCEGAVCAHDGANLTITGGNIHGQVCADCDFSMAVWAYGKETTVTITGGNFTNDSDGSNHSDLIYVKDGAKIKIEGGTFKCATPSWTLNSHDSKSGLIEVTGGRFYKFNPATANDEAGDNGNGIAPDGKVEVVVLDDYKVVQDGDWYEVVCAHKNCTFVEGKVATITSEGQKEYYECDLCKKMFTDENAIDEITDKNSLIIPKLIEVVNNEAKVSEEAMDEAIETAANSSTVVIPVLDASANVTSVSVPVNSLSTIADADKTLLVETSEVKITLDAKSIEKIASQVENAEEVKIEVTKVEEKTLNNKQKDAIKNQDVAVVISAKIIAGEKEISDFGGGKVKVEIPFTPAENTKPTDYKVVYIDDEGNVTIIPSKFVKGKMVVELEHFSKYAIVKDKKVENEVENKVENEVENKVENKVNNVTTNNTSQEPKEEAKDETPKTGAKSIVIFVAVIALVGLVIIKKEEYKK